MYIQVASGSSASCDLVWRLAEVCLGKHLYRRTNRQLYVFVRRSKRFTGQGDFERKTWDGREVACLRHVRNIVFYESLSE